MRSPAYATAVPRAPDGSCEPVPLWIVRRCSALASPTSHRKRQSVCDCIRLPPVPKHPGTAHPCAFAVFPCLGPAMSGCFGSAMQSRFDRVGFLLRAPKTKRPRVLEPEGVRVASGDRGDRSPRCERISRCWWCRNNSACCEAAAHRAVRTRAGPHRAWAMAAVQRCGRNASWKSCVGKSPSGEVAHLTRAFFVWQQNFYITDERHVFRNSMARAPRWIHRDALRCCDAFPAVGGPRKARIAAGFCTHRSAKKKPAERRASSGELDPRLRGDDVPAEAFA